jgi:hypothetical protein
MGGDFIIKIVKEDVVHGIKVIAQIESEGPLHEATIIITDLEGKPEIMQKLFPTFKSAEAGIDDMWKFIEKLLAP